MHEIIKEQKLDEEFNKFKNEANKSIDELFVKFKELKSKNNNFGYLICENCLGYYQLQKDESIDDFVECECGGSLNFLKNYYILNFFQGMHDISKNFWYIINN